jgi:hypothetical protein
MAYTTKTHGDNKPVFAIDVLNGSGSATTGVPVQIAGPKLDFFNIDCGADIAAQMGLGGAVERVLTCITQLATVHFYQAEASSGQLSVAVYPTGAWAAADLQTAIRALDTGSGYRLNGATVSNNGFVLA